MSLLSIHRNRRRRGMIVPLVMVGMLLLLTMSVALQQAAWRSARGARTQWDSQRGLYSADAALVRALATWRADSMAATPIGERVEWIEPDVDGWTTRVSLARTGTLTAAALAVTQRSRAVFPMPVVRRPDAIGDVTRIQRTVVYALRLDPPSLPLLGAVTVLGDVALDAATIDGRDQVVAYEPTRDDCGPWRDSVSVAALASVTRSVRVAPLLFGAVTTVPAVAASRTRFDSGFAQIIARARPAVLTPSGGIPSTASWRASVIQQASAVMVDDTSQYVGLLAVDGDLVIRGALRVDGLLVVRGAIDVSAGLLDVRGALVIRDASALGSQLGAGVQVTYAPCLAGRALVPVATPNRLPFGVWNSP